MSRPIVTEKLRPYSQLSRSRVQSALGGILPPPKRCDYRPFTPTCQRRPIKTF